MKYEAWVSKLISSTMQKLTSYIQDCIRFEMLYIGQSKSQKTKLKTGIYFLNNR